MPTIKSSSQSSSEKSSNEGGNQSKKKPPPSERLLGNWLAAYGEYTSESESPDDFHMWVGLSILASAVRRNVWLDQGIYLLFVNLFVILIGPAGIGKSTPIRMGRKLLLDIDDMIFGPDSVTREELIRLMAKAGKDKSQSAMILHSSELSSLIDPSGIKMIQFLTEIFDGDFKFKHGTKHSGSSSVHNPILNMLAGTTPSWVAEGLPSTVVAHGFTSRTVFVWGDKPRYLKPFPNRPDAELVRSLVSDLWYISLLEGEFTWGVGSKDLYEKIYTEIANSVPSDYRIEGFHARKKIHVLKIAMLLSLAEDDSLEITTRDLDIAYEIASAVQVNMHKAFSALGKYDHASDLERLESRIRQEEGMTTQQIYSEFYAVGDVMEIGKMITMLLTMGRISKSKDIKGNPLYVIS